MRVARNRELMTARLAAFEWACCINDFYKTFKIKYRVENEILFASCYTKSVELPFTDAHRALSLADYFTFYIAPTLGPLL